MDISITDQDGNTLEITLGSDVSLVVFCQRFRQHPRLV